jgi:small-conductance mechanosensitive channel
MPGISRAGDTSSRSNPLLHTSHLQFSAKLLQKQIIQALTRTMPDWVVMNVSSELREPMEMQRVAGKVVRYKRRLALSLFFAVACMSQSAIGRAQESTEMTRLCGESQTAAQIGVTAGLIATDPQTMPHFRQTNAFSGFNRVFSGAATAGIIAAVRPRLYSQPDSQECVRPELGAVGRGSRGG